MARRIVHDDVDIEVGRNVPLDLVEETAEFPCAVARHAALPTIVPAFASRAANKVVTP